MRRYALAGVVAVIILTGVFLYFILTAEEETEYEVYFTDASGETVRGYLIKPKGDGPFPAVIMVHGGPGGNWNMTLKMIEGELAQKLLSAGFVVLSVDYGPKGLFCMTDFCLAGDDVEDTIAAVEYLKTLPFVNASAISLIGSSHGGYAVLYVAERLGNEILSVVDCYGPTNLTDISLHVGLTVTDENKSALEEWSPLTWVNNLSAPVMLVHGTADTTVPVSHSDIFAQKLHSLGKPHIYLRYEGQKHGFAIRMPGRETPISNEVTDKIRDFLVNCTAGLIP